LKAPATGAGVRDFGFGLARDEVVPPLPMGVFIAGERPFERKKKLELKLLHI